MNGLLQQRRREIMLNFGAGLIVLALLPVTGVIAWRAIRDSNAAQGVISLPSRAVPLTPTAIFAVTDEENFLTSLTVMALTPQGAGGTVMVIPVGALVGGRPVGKPQRLADVYGSDGVEALQNAVEAMTNSQIEQITVNGVDGTAELLARVGTVNATFSTDVTDTESEISDVIAEKGSVDLTPMEMSAVLAARDISGDEAGQSLLWSSPMWGRNRPQICLHLCRLCSLDRSTSGRLILNASLMLNATPKILMSTAITLVR